LDTIKLEISKLIKKAYKKSFSCKHSFELEINKTKEEKFGDYSSNIAMISTKELKIPPRQIAEKIIENIEKNNIIKKIEIAGPGFINLFLNNNIFIETLKNLLNFENNFWKPNLGKKKKVVIEYSQPNIAKPLGVHHLLSTIIGQSISNIYEYLNFEVIRVNHIGDWGTQFGKLIYAYKTWGDKKTIDNDPINELLKLYIKFHEEVEAENKTNKKLEDKGRKEFKKLEERDEENIKLWKWIRKISLKDVKKTYKKLEGITFKDKDYIGESFYNDKMEEILEEGKKKKIFTLSEGAFIAKINEKTPPLIVQKKDGTTIYATRDLAQIKYRSTLEIVKNIMVVDTAQSLHFRQCFYVANKLKLNQNKQGKVDLEHVVFGRMSLPDKDMSTRKGNIILLDSVLDEAIERAYNLIDNINPQMPNNKKKSLAKSSGLGAIKYNILSQNRIHNITFIWDNMISLDGNCAPYIQYTHARACSILRKNYLNNSNNLENSNNFEITKEIEKTLIKKILEFPTVLQLAQEMNMPHHIATFIYDLSAIFNKFYNSYPVLKSENKIKNTRLALVQLVSHILKIGLNLLVINAPEEM